MPGAGGCRWVRYQSGNRNARPGLQASDLVGSRSTRHCGIRSSRADRSYEGTLSVVATQSNINFALDITPFFARPQTIHQPLKLLGVLGGILEPGKKIERLGQFAAVVQTEVFHGRNVWRAPQATAAASVRPTTAFSTRSRGRTPRFVSSTLRCSPATAARSSYMNAWRAEDMSVAFASCHAGRRTHAVGTPFR